MPKEGEQKQSMLAQFFEWLINRAWKHKPDKGFIVLEFYQGISSPQSHGEAHQIESPQVQRIKCVEKIFQ